MNNDRKVLKIKIQKEINCYLSNAYFLCIILAYENMLPWFFENYTQLYFCPEKSMRNSNDLEIFLDFYGGWTEPRKILQCDCINRNVLEDTDILEYIESSIREGFYLYTYIDEFYTINRQELHNSHDIFVYGFDKSKSEIMVIGFDNKYNFTDYCISYSTFRKAFVSGIQIARKTDKRNGEDYCRLIRPSFKENEKYLFNKDNFLSLLNDYLHSINTANKIITEDPNYALYKSHKNIFGISVYEKIIQYLSSVINLQINIDYRPLHTLYEHKSIMYKRLQFIFSQYNIIDRNNYIKQCMDLEIECNTLRLLCIKYNINKKPKIINTMIEKLVKQKEIENNLFPGIYNLLID